MILRTKPPLEAELDTFNGLALPSSLPRLIKNFVKDYRGTPGGGGSRFALQTHQIEFSSGIFLAIWP